MNEIVDLTDMIETDPKEEMRLNLELQILEFIQNRYRKGETTSSRHVHIRFDIDFSLAENILEKLSTKSLVTKSYDEEYQEIRYSQLLPVKE